MGARSSATGTEPAETRSGFTAPVPSAVRFFALDDHYGIEPRGSVQVKGRGEMDAYFVVLRVAPGSTG